jgi:Fe-S-cluster containining protein
MTGWEELLGRKWPKNACDRSGECCRGAAQYAPWRNILPLAASGDATARDFLNQYMPYPNIEIARQNAPDGVAASLKIARANGQAEDEIIFYRCRFLTGQNQCQIYEDRPTLCRTYPESPFGAIASCCGYYGEAQSCLSQIEDLREELAELKRQQAGIMGTSQP